MTQRWKFYSSLTVKLGGTHHFRILSSSDIRQRFDAQKKGVILMSTSSCGGDDLMES